MLLLDDARCVDIDHRGRDAFDDRRKRQFELAGGSRDLPPLSERIGHCSRQQAKRSGDEKCNARHKHLDSIRPYIGAGPRPQQGGDAADHFVRSGRRGCPRLDALLHRAGVEPLGVDVTIDKFDHRNRRGIAVTETGLEHPRIAAVAVLVAGADHLE